MAQFFTSDLHFGCKSVYKDYSRPFKNYDTYEDTIIRNINSVVSSKDELYVVGDFIDYSDHPLRSRNWEHSIEIVNRLNGRKILILGNNETRLARDLFGDTRSFQKYVIDSGFLKCLEECNVVINNNMFHLVHDPKDCRVDVLNLFGHIHKDIQSMPYGINVSCDLWGFYPVSYEQLYWYVDRTLNYSLPMGYVNRAEEWDRSLWESYRSVWRQESLKR